MKKFVFSQKSGGIRFSEKSAKSYNFNPKKDFDVENNMLSNIYKTK